MAYEFQLQRRVEFSETDMAGIVHYANFFRYMEAAEHAFFRSLGLSIVTTQVQPAVGWPRVHARCDYLSPLRFEDQVGIHLLVKEKRSKAITYLFRFYKLADPAPMEVARGELTVVCTTRDAAGKMSAHTIPDAVAARIEAAPAAVQEAWRHPQPGRGGG